MKKVFMYCPLMLTLTHKPITAHIIKKHRKVVERVVNLKLLKSYHRSERTLFPVIFYNVWYLKLRMLNKRTF